MRGRNHYLRQLFVPESEKAVQLRVCRIYEAFGCWIYSLSQARASMQSAGLPDLYIVHPTKGAWWHETKRPKVGKRAGGRQSPAQKIFQERCAGAGVGYVLGGADDAYQQLARVGLISLNDVRLKESADG